MVRITNKNKAKKSKNDANTTNGDDKKLDIYRNALKRTFKAGTENIDEDPMLVELRKTLHIGAALHQKLKGEVKSELEKSDAIQKESKLKISNMERQVSDFKKKGMDAEHLEELIEQSKKARKAQAYKEFNDIFKEYSKSSNTLRRQFKIHHQINNVKTIIIKVEKMGANVKDVKQLILKAESALEKEQFSQASKLATNARKASITLRKFGTAQKQIQSFLSTFNKAKKKFIVKDSQKLLRQAQKALRKNDYVTVSKSIKAAKIALQASKRKSVANEKVKKIHELVQNARSLGVDIVPILPLVKQMERNLEEGKFKKFTKEAAVLRKVVEENRKQKTAEDKVDEARIAVEKARKSGSSVKTASRYLSQAKTALKKKKYTQIHKYARSAIKLAKDAMTTAIRRKASSAISSAKFLIKDVKDFGVEVKEAEELLAKAEEAFKKNDYVNVEQFAKVAEQVAKKTFELKKKEYLMKSIEETLINIKFMIDELREIGGDAKDIEKLYDQGQSQLEAGDLKAADKTVKEGEILARDTLEKAKYEYQITQANKSIEETKMMISEAEDLDIELSSVEPIMKEAEELLEEKKYENVIEKTDEIKSKISELKDSVLKNRTETLIEATKTFLEKAKGDGVDISEAEKIMDDAKIQLNARNYSAADGLVRRCEEITKKAWNKHQLSSSEQAISVVEEILGKAQEHGVDVAAAKNVLSEASSKLDEEEYDAAKELISKAESMATGDWEIQRKLQAEGSLENFKKILNDLTISGPKVDEFKDLIDNIEEKINSGDFEAVSEYINRANVISSELLLEEKATGYSERIDRNEELIKKLDESGIEIEELEKLIITARELYANKDYQKVESSIEEIESKSNELLVERWNDISPTLMKSVQDNIEKSREIGGDVEKAEEFLSEAERVMDEDDFSVLNVEELISKAEMEAKHSWVQRKTEMTEEAVNTAQTMIQESKEMGADVSDAEDLLNELEGMFEEEDFELIDDQLEKVTDMVETRKREQKSKLVSEAVSSTKDLLNETRDMGAHVDAAEDLLKEAENMFGEEDFDAVEEIVKKAEEAIETSKIEFKRDETSKLVSSTKAKIEEGRGEGADVSEAEKLLKEAEDMLLTEFDYDTVEDLVQKSQSSLATSWDQYKSQKLIDDISQMHGKIVDFREMGVNVTEAELLLHKAEEEYKKDNFENVDNLLEKINDIVKEEYDEHFISKITILINDVQTLINQAKERNLDVKVAEDILNEAISEFENKNYPKAEELATKAKEVVTEIMESSEIDEVQNILDRVKNLIRDAKVLNIDVSPAERLYRQAQALFKAKEFESAREYAYKSETILNSLAEKYVKDFHPNLTVDIKTPELLVHKWNRFSLRILNDGRISAQEVIIDLKGELETKGKKKIPLIETDGVSELELGLKSTKAGELPVKIFVHCNRPFDKNEYDFTDSIKLKLLDPGKFVVQDVFVIYADGCLIMHRTREYREMVDDDIFSSMLIAVQNFISDSFGRSPDEGIKRLDFGTSKILIETGPKFFLATVIEGDEPGLLPMYMIEIINEIQERFGEVMENWDGYLEKLEGVGEIIDKLLNLKIVEGTRDIEPASLMGPTGGEGEGDGAGEGFGGGVALGVGEEPGLEEGPGLGEGTGLGTIDSVQGMIEEAKEQGIDTTDAEEALEKATSMVESSGYTEVWGQVNTAKELVRNARKEHYHDDVKSALNTIKEMIDEAKNYGANVSEAEETYNKMRGLIEREEFPKALELAETSKVLIQQAKEEKDTLDSLDEMNNNINIVTSWGLDPPNLSKENEEINTAIENKEYEKAKSIIIKVNNDLKESVIKKPVEALPFVVIINKNVDDISNFGVDTSESEESILSAKDAIYNLNFSKADDLLQLVNSNISGERTNLLQTKTSETISTVKNTMGELQDLNIDVDEAISILSDAESKLSSDDYEAAYEAAVKSKEIVDGASHSFHSQPILKTIITTENMVAQAKAQGVDESQVQPIENLINESRAALEAKDYNNAGEIATQANTSALDSFDFIKEAQDELITQLDSTLTEISSTKEVGADTAEVEDLAEKMKKVLEEGDLEATKDYWENIKGTLEHLQIPFKTELIKNEIDSLEQYLNESKEKGIDTTEAGHLLENAKTIFETGDLDSSKEYVDKARAVLDDANETHRAVVISETIQNTYQLANEIKEMGAEVSYSYDLLKQAEAMLRKMDLDSAEEFATNAFNTTEEIKKQFLSSEAREQIEKASQMITSASEAGLKTTDAERLLAQAKEYLNAGELDNANQYAINTQHLVKDIKEQDLEKQAKEEMIELQKLYVDVKNMGADVKEADAPLMQAQASINNKDFEIAITYLDTVKTTLKEIKQPFMVKLANTALARAKKVIENASNYGADVTGAQDLFEEAQDAFNAQDFSTAEEKAKEAEKVALWAEKNYYDDYVSNEIKNLKENIENLKNQGYDTKEAEDQLGIINTLYLEKNFQKIGEKIKNLHQLLVKLEEKRFIERATDAISYTKAMINYIKNNIKDIGARIKAPEKLLKSAENEFNNNKEYLRAEQFALEANRTVENIKHSKLDQFLFVFRQLQAEEMLTRTRKVLAEIKKFSVDVSESEELVKKAEEAFSEEEKYSEGQELLTEAKIKAREQENKYQEKNAGSAISTAESLIITLKQKGVDAETANKFLAQAKTAFEIKEFKKSILFASKAKMTAKKLHIEEEPVSDETKADIANPE
jgi:hypothetical protein